MFLPDSFQGRSIAFESGCTLAALLRRASRECKAELVSFALPNGREVRNIDEISDNAVLSGIVSTSKRDLIRSAVRSMAGTRYAGLNQDAHALQEFDVQGAQVWLWGVFDGHSMCGEIASTIAAVSMVDYLKQYFQCEEYRGMDEELIEMMYECAHEAILAAYEYVPDEYFQEGKRWRVTDRNGGERWYVPVGESDEPDMPVEFGTTATTVLKWGGVLIVAHAGDTRCVLGQQLANSDEIASYDLTLDHSLSNETEQQRISANDPAPSTTHDGYLSMPFNSETNLQLAMTRSLGHAHLSKYGITHEPEIFVHELSDTDRFVIIASDGLWESISSGEAVQIVAACTTPEEAAEQLLARAASNDQDNTTALVVFLR